MKVAVSALVFLLLFLPSVTNAGLVPVACVDPQQCGTCEFVSTVNSVLQFIISVLIPLIVVGMFIYAGFLLVVSRGDVATLTTARGIFANAGIGIIFVLLSFLIVNTVIAGLSGGTSGRIIGWNQLECTYPRAAADIYFGIPDSRDMALLFGSSSAGVGRSYARACEIPESGPCSVESLRAAGFNRPEEAAMIVGMESGCNTMSRSRTDRTTDGRTTSVGIWQIHMPVHRVNCGGVSLDCPSAFRDSGRRHPQFNVRMYDVVNESLYDQCVQALHDPQCNNSIAANLANRSGDMGDWACSALRCGIHTSRNHLCPL